MGRGVAKTLEGLGFERSVYQPSVFFHHAREIVLTVHVDDYLVSGTMGDREWLYMSLKAKYDLKRTVPTPASVEEARYLHRHIRWVNGELAFEGMATIPSSC